MKMGCPLSNEKLAGLLNLQIYQFQKAGQFVISSKIDSDMPIWTPTTNLNQAVDYCFPVLMRMRPNWSYLGIMDRAKDFIGDVYPDSDHAGKLAQGIVDLALNRAESYPEEWAKAVESMGVAS